MVVSSSGVETGRLTEDPPVLFSGGFRLLILQNLPRKTYADSEIVCNVLVRAKKLQVSCLLGSVLTPSLVRDNELIQDCVFSSSCKWTMS